MRQVVASLTVMGCFALQAFSPPEPARAQLQSVATEPRAEPFLADDCLPPLTAPDQEIAAQSDAIVPLKPGLTLSTTWHRAKRKGMTSSV